MPNYKKGGMSGMRNATEGQVMPRTQFGGPPKEIWESALQTRSLVKRARNEVTSFSASFSDSRMCQPCCALQARARGEKLDDDSEEDDEPQPEPKRVFSEAESSGRETSRRKEVCGPRRAPNPLRQTCHPSRETANAPDCQAHAERALDVVAATISRVLVQFQSQVERLFAEEQKKDIKAAEVGPRIFAGLPQICTRPNHICPEPSPPSWSVHHAAAAPCPQRGSCRNGAERGRYPGAARSPTRVAVVWLVVASVEHP